MTSLFSTYKRWDIEIEKGNGAVVTDTNGKEYLDFVSGIAVCNLGHCHPAVMEAVKQQLNKVWHVSNLFQNSLQEEVAQLLTANSDGQYVFFCNSGAEANEAAIKLARKHTKRSKIITFFHSFHGRTFATMSATAQSKIHDGFGPLLPTFVYTPYNDISALREAMDEETAAIMVEAIQGEGGVLPATKEFLQEIEKLCTQYGALMIVDEVQAGIGRTGKAFAYQHAGVSPDIITIAKALGNGIPTGAMIGKEKLAESFGPGVHGSTFGGNLLAMAAAKTVLQTIFNESFLQDVAEKGVYFLQLLHDEIEPLPVVKEVRGNGLLLGIECKQEVGPLIEALQQKGLLVLSAGSHVIRILPPLLVTKDEIQKAVQMLHDVLEKSYVSIS
ncbi:acetylornithine transaminase [Ectobacillus polymachus]|uniref:acetylornithine transaminase n=1 Tax=Ectobacillus polymachus TaxID=1508806 RepID=UPI003A8656C6